MSEADLDPAVIALMERLQADPREAGCDQTIETHAARVFLVGDRAYKIKKPVDLGFLDFSTLERRTTALEAELRLNQGGAPHLYRRLIWVTRKPDGGLELDGDGARVEPVLEMARFDQGGLLARLAGAGQVDGALARDLADAVFESHVRAEPRRVASGSDRIRAVLADAARRCGQAPGAPAQRVRTIARQLDRRLQEKADLLDSRGGAGFVRRCHGDLHLNNIVRLDGAPVLFDALEFDEDLAVIDTLYDLAFLVMDLIRYGLGREAAALLSQYAARLDGDHAVEGIALLPAFCGVRALIKALTCLERAAPGDGLDAAACLDLAERCGGKGEVRLIGVGGLSGTGKSTLAEGVAPHVGPPPGALVIRADLERKALEGVGWRDALPKSAYTREASRRVYDRQRDKAARALRAGCSVIMDAVHSRESERLALEAAARDAQADFLGVWLDAEAPVIRSRVSARRDDPSDADLEVVEKQAAYDAGEIGWTRVDATRGADAVLGVVRELAGLA